MKLCVVAIYDVATETYGRPIFTPAKGYALRSFRDEIARDHEENNMYKHPEDFDLFFLGMFDDQTGQFDQTGAERIMRGRDVKAMTE